MKKKRLIVCLDGLGYAEISKDKTPFLYSFAKKNYIARLKTLLAFTGIEYSFFNGNLPDDHKVFLEFKYSPKTSCFKWQKYFWFLGRNFLSYTTALFQYIFSKGYLTKLYSIPLNIIHNFDVSTKKGPWDLKMFKNKNYVLFKWPLLVKNGKKTLKLFNYSDFKRCQLIINSISKNIDLYAVHLVELDKVAHKHGKDTFKYTQQIKKLDKLAKFLVTNFKKKIPDIEVIFWSDHYFINIKKIINIKNLLPKSNDYLVFIGGTSLSFWFKNKKIKKTIINLLKKIKEGYILTEKERKKYNIPTNIENGELIFVVKPGNYIFPNYYQAKIPYKAMHGYEPDKYNSDGILITDIKLKKKSYSLDEIINL